MRLSFCARARERKKDRLAKIQTLGQGEILLHPFRINLQLFDNVTQLRQHVVEQVQESGKIMRSTWSG